MLQNTTHLPGKDDLPPSANITLLRYTLEVSFSGNWQLNRSIPDATRFASQLNYPAVKELYLKTNNLGIWDSSLIAFIKTLIDKAQSQQITINDHELPAGIKNLIQLAFQTPPNKEAHKKITQISFLEYIGDITLSLPNTIQKILTFLGEMTLSTKRLITGHSDCNSTNIWRCIQQAGVEALPIVSLISLLVGLILAFVGVIQLRMFGAEIYVSSLVAIGMTRIMGAVMTGVILSGRTGASYAATIGTMNVNEEIDALMTFGIRPSDFLVMPRLIALTTMTPLLVIYSDFMGMLGGFIVGVGILGIEPLEYINFTQKGFALKNLWVGIIHGVVFGIIIAITGCYQGLNSGKNASAVGLATTSAVVYSIVGIVIATACLTIIFNIFNI